MVDEEEKKFHTADVLVSQNYLFSNFLLSEKLLKSLHEMKYIKPSPIQVKTIPLARSRLDMIIQSKSGTGKTLSFAICLLETYDEDIKFPQALIVVPTREIAVQITNNLESLGIHMKYFKACEFIGGTDMKNDRKRIQTAKIVIGTPGRILHLINNAIFNTTCIKTIVLDEADKLLESGQMAKDVQSILKKVRENNDLQIIAATATVSTQFEEHIKRFMKNPIGITPKHEAPILLGIKQFAIQLQEQTDNIELMRMKVAELEKIFTKVSFKQCLLFTDSQLRTESYGNYLKKLGWKNEVINGSQEQTKRLRVLDKLTKFKCRVLITTDLMARGIDIENVNLVINLDLPYDCFTYLHRIGRAGRFGTLGLAITFLNGEKDKEKFKKMLGEIGSSKSLVYEFPDENVSYNFWDFNNTKQDEKLKRVDVEVVNDIDENTNLEQNSDDKDKSLLQEIEKMLIGNNGADSYKCSNNGSLDKNSKIDSNRKFEEKTSEDDIVERNLMLLDISKKLIDDTQNEQNSNLFDASILLNDYEKFCENENENLPPEEQQESPKSDFRKVIFKRNPLDEEYEESISSKSDYSKQESEESVGDEIEFDEEKSICEESQPNLQNLSRTFEENASGYENYNQYVAHYYNQWRNTFHFQLANIENYVKYNKSNLT
ncbi:hypothetical protein PVAND_003781 [Polypedilum vanderplanki]|uniref:RNA helicase n=1 Tax=Polypedilum vanderplanki TaxID=319348 RepID=A0A9J6BV27_POLVA|nr:hypothetical protein PVAND_003781 [Polypedilum vanderplanki]